MTIPVDFAQATFTFGGPGCPEGAAVTLGINHELSPLDATAVAGTLYGYFASDVLPALSSNVQLESCRVKFGPDDTGPVGLWELATSGSDIDNISGPQVCYLVRKLTSFGGHRSRGRMYLPGVTEGDVDNSGIVSPGKVAIMQSNLDSFQGKIEADDLLPALLHGPGQSAEPAPSFITGFAMQTKVATQRRRIRP